jgi:hypothetical protein
MRSRFALAMRNRRPNDDIARRLCALHGVFLRSRMEEFLVRFWVTFMPIGGACGIGFAVYRAVASTINPGDIIIRIGGGVFLALGAYGARRRIGVHFQIDSGRLSELGPTGSARWTEDLNGLVSTLIWIYSGMTALLLRWPDRARTVELPTSLYRAMVPDH